MLASNDSTFSQLYWGLTGRTGSFRCTAYSDEGFLTRGYATTSFNPASQRAWQHSAAATSSPDQSDSALRREAELAASAPSKTKSDGTIGIRWYKHVGVEETEDSTFHVTLDGKRLPSPARRPLVLPTKELALAIAAEWEWQDKKSIRPFTMPLMKLASTATDLVPLQRNAIVDNLMKYFRTSDAVCVRDPGEGRLKRKQAEIWDPLLDWMQQELGVRPVTSGSIFGAEQPPEVVRTVQELLHRKSDFRLAAVDALASSAHSLVIALAVSRGHLGPRKALEAVRVEEDHQMEEWGLVEGGHDLDIADTKVRIAAPSLFLRLLDE
ncbi:F1-ATP synthase assembly protein [Klebsormidium nitens]|uniref:F1-ATP synthase assembly protein n=1 Tax=Klebsormidium nitens TaxID=105231 RepID=A0A1Y1I6T8_KLENI|nr:F1-ATP synthase assembly protein [Klebsormidium nitens]|eukprot:GAQ85652.1 F1-ATP synthase assembly protein [Klebsormidium nitens]